MPAKNGIFRVLHVASFFGNVGDNISHLGLRNLISGVIGGDYGVVGLEIRRTYVNYSLPDKLILDDSFAELCKSFHLIVFGGGNLLEPFAANPSGTRLNIDQETFNEISAPILFASIGLAPRTLKDTDPKTAKKHRTTLEFLAQKSNVEIVVRNDGSPNWLANHEPSIFQAFKTGLDAGFFASRDARARRLSSGLTSQPVALNLSLDQISSSIAMGGGTYDKYLATIAARVTERLETSSDNFIFVPHVHDDLRVFADLMEKIADFYARSRFSVSHLVAGESGGLETLRAYEMAQEVWSMRFHSVIAAIVTEKPLVPLVAMGRLASLLESVGYDGDRVDLMSNPPDSGPLNPVASYVSEEKLQIMKGDTQQIYKDSLAAVLGSKF